MNTSSTTLQSLWAGTSFHHYLSDEYFVLETFFGACRHIFFFSFPGDVINNGTYLYESTRIKIPGTDFLFLQKAVCMGKPRQSFQKCLWKLGDECPLILRGGLEEKSCESTSKMMLQAALWLQEIWFRFFLPYYFSKTSEEVSQAQKVQVRQSHMYFWLTEVHGGCKWIQIPPTVLWASECAKSHRE